MGEHRPAVLLGGQVHHQAGLSGQRSGQPVSPEGVQIRAAVHRQTGLHLQAVGRHAVEGAEHAIKAGEDAQMFLKIGELAGLKDAGGHVLILDALIGEQGAG